MKIENNYVLSIVIAVFLVLPFFAGCVAQETRDIAKILKEQVVEYDKEVDKRRNNELIYYEKTFNDYSKSKVGTLKRRIKFLEQENSIRYADKLAEKPNENTTRTSMFDFLLNSANQEFQLYKNLNEEELNTKLLHLSFLKKNDETKKEMDVLKKQLLELELGKIEKRKMKDTAKFLEELEKKVNGKELVDKTSSTSNK